MSWTSKIPDLSSVSFLGDSTTTDVLGLMHERTGHQNKRSLFECVKSKLITGLEIEEKHIRKYKKDDRHVFDICARAKLTRTIFKKFHTIRGKELGDYISVDIAVFVNCESRTSCVLWTTQPSSRGSIQ